MLVLGIESSCDETGVALVQWEGQAVPTLLAHALYSQIEMHQAFGGVVPELASRDHIRRVLPLTREVLANAHRSLAQVDVVAYTRGPGLAGALLANLTGLASPNLLQWMQSGTLLVMVIIGGVGYLYGGLVGAVILLCLEEVLSGFTLHWHIGLGFLLLGVVLFAPKGVAALFGKRHG